MMLRINLIRKVKGFSLIELMIVVAIIGILAAVATPAYRNYVIRSKFSNLITYASNLQSSINDIASSGTLTAGNMTILPIGTDSTVGGYGNNVTGAILVQSVANAFNTTATSSCLQIMLKPSAALNAASSGGTAALTPPISWTCTSTITTCLAAATVIPAALPATGAGSTGFAPTTCPGA